MGVIINPIPSAWSEKQWLKISCTGLYPTPQTQGMYFHSSQHYPALQVMGVGKTIPELLDFRLDMQGMQRKLGSTSSLAWSKHSEGKDWPNWGRKEEMIPQLWMQCRRVRYMCVQGLTGFYLYFFLRAKCPMDLVFARSFSAPKPVNSTCKFMCCQNRKGLFNSQSLSLHLFIA